MHTEHRWRRSAVHGLLGLGTVMLALGVMPAGAQEPPDSIRAELARLRARIDSLEALIARLEPGGAEQQDALSRLRAAAAQAAAAGAGRGEESPQEETESQSRQRSLQALNPEISVSADLFAHVDQDDASQSNFVAREFEFAFQSALDPFSRAKIFLSHHEAGPEIVPFGGEPEGESHEEGGFGVEEGFVEWVGLPGSISLKVGKFFQRFGALNRWHAHALQFQSRSLPHLAFIGEESLAQTGVSASWLAPFGGTGTYEATLEVTRSSNESLFGSSSKTGLLAHVNAFWETSASTDLDLGLSVVDGDFEDEEGSFGRTLFGAEFAFTWRPPERARYREFVLRGGAMLLDGLGPAGGQGGLEGTPESSALGLWAWADNRLSPQWLLGARGEWVENPADPGDSAWMFSPTLTWWQSEWVRLRLEYDLLGRSFEDDKEGRLWFWVTFAMGPHKHETY